VFLQFTGYPRYYSAANPKYAAPLVNGQWASTIFIGEAKPITLWLVSLSPAQVQRVNKLTADYTAGYPNLPGVVLNSVTFRAKPLP
jgi:hypothetical protein